ncbi:unnamed protein product [Wuchereria bancrofti]|uniref:Protein S-acyltransferase n=1 Tax=Wuchereria bancrofti TaxID=6293 RepID=A0A3P7DY87_WUCBA|nr:unnamed protein product [Wuchereria bancrofti]
MFLSYFIIVITGGRGGGRVAMFEMICSNNVCLRSIISFIRWLPVIFILALLCWAYFAYVVQLCFFTVEGTFERSLYLSVFHLLLFMFLWSYYVTIFRPVGRPPKMFYVDSQTRQDLSSLEESECRQILERYVRQHQIPVDNRNGDGSMVYVTVTNVIASNLIDATIALFVVTAFFSVLRSHFVPLGYTYRLAILHCILEKSFRPPVFIYGIDKNGFNLGIRRNFRQVFGDTYLFWFLPIFSSYGDGVQYPVGSRARQQSHGLHCTGKVYNK